MPYTQLWALIALSLQVEPSVTVHSPTAQWVTAQGNATFRFGVTVNNGLDIPLSGVDIGVVYASDETALKLVDPTDIYGTGETLTIGGTTIGLRLSIVDEIASQSSSQVSREIPSTQALRDSTVAPRAFVSHLLGYRFAANPLPIWDKLLHSKFAPDEWAVVESLGLLSVGRSRFAARKMWRETRGSLDEIAEYMSFELSSDPKQSALFSWVTRILALGIVGGEGPMEVLTSLEKRRDLSRLDEGFQILRLARLTQSVYESPLAFVIPPQVATIKDLLGYAKSLCSENFDESLVYEDILPGNRSLGIVEVSGSTPSTVGMGWGLVAGFCFGVIGVWFWNSRKRQK